MLDASAYGTPYEIRTRVAAVKGQCPGPLDERCIFGAGNEDRTRDLMVGNQPLYP